MYSGQNEAERRIAQDAWVFSIPAFRWFEAPIDEPSGRFLHSCIRVGSQMVIVGGVGPGPFEERDDFTRGIGILDLNTFEWKDEFEPDPAPYTGLQAIDDWYEEK